jgi:hypothetical protein
MTKIYESKSTVFKGVKDGHEISRMSPSVSFG